MEPERELRNRLAVIVQVESAGKARIAGCHVTPVADRRRTAFDTGDPDTGRRIAGRSGPPLLPSVVSDLIQKNDIGADPLDDYRRRL